MSRLDTLKILIVDDEEIVGHILKEFHSLLGHRTECVENGLAGLQELESGRYDAAYVDIRMPGIDGINFLKQSRKMHPGLPIVIISGHGSDEIRKEIIEAGAFAFLPKPFRFDEIQELFEKISAARYC